MSKCAIFLDKIRKEERRILTKSGFIQSYEVSLIPVVPVVSTVLLFLVHTLLGYPLDASAVSVWCHERRVIKLAASDINKIVF